MDGKRECVDRYEKSVITVYFNSAHRICSNEVDLENEINYLKNSKYTMEANTTQTIKYMKKFLKQIMKNNIRPCKHNYEIKLMIYYKKQNNY